MQSMRKRTSVSSVLSSSLDFFIQLTAIDCKATELGHESKEMTKLKQQDKKWWKFLPISNYEHTFSPNIFCSQTVSYMVHVMSSLPIVDNFITFRVASYSRFLEQWNKMHSWHLWKRIEVLEDCWQLILNSNISCNIIHNLFSE